jgi:cell wall-associated NlpC family hydrolase
MNDNKPRKKRRKIVFFRKRRKPYVHVLFAGINICLLMFCLTFLCSSIINLYPYAITANGEVLCYVEDKDTGADALQKAVKDLLKEESEVLAVSLGDSFEIERNYKQTKKQIETESSDSAAACISKAIKEDPDAFPEISVATTHKEIRQFIPEPTYEIDETAFAGSKVVKEEGSAGTKEITVNSIVVNGKVVDSEDVEEVVLDEGKSEVVVKGKLGLPKDADWQEYEGDPVYSNGDDIVTTAVSMVGKVQYVKGGTNLETGVDCVGFVRAIYRLYGVNLSSHLGREGYAVSYADAQPGDILNFSHHVGIYMGNGMMVDAANTKEDVRVVSVSACRQKLIDVRHIPTT